MNSGTYASPNQIAPTDPSLATLLDLRKKDIMLTLNCHAIGTITSFDAVTQTAQATINYAKSYTKKGTNGVYETQLVNYAPITGAPVIFLGGGDSYLTFPVEPGDECLILFNDRDLDNWFTNNGQTTASTRLHAFTDAVILVGLRSLTNSISFDQERALLVKGNAQVGVGKDGDLVLIGNADYTLNQLLGQLITQIKSLVSATAAITVLGVTSGAGTSGLPSNATTISAIGTQLTDTADQLSQLLE